MPAPELHRQGSLAKLPSASVGVKATYPAGRIRFATQTPNHIQIVAGAGKQRAGVIKR